jgi:ABC-2 type transport system ATP-binding protein/ABC-2 type transport system permease protein
VIRRLPTAPAGAGPDASPPPAVRLDGVAVVRGGRPVLSGIDLAIPRGSITGLFGPSGCGKTTLLRVIVGLQRTAAGSAEVLGRPAGSAPLRQQVAYVAQGASVYRDLTVDENLRYFARLLGAGPEDRRRALEVTELAGLEGRRVSMLSGGQSARVSLATALLGGPQVLVLDEPTTGIDPVLRAQLWATLRRLADGGATLLVSSHVMEESDFCDELVLMRDGRVLAAEAPDVLQERTGQKTITDAFIHLVGRGARPTGAPEGVRRRRAFARWLAALRAARPELPSAGRTAATATRVLHQLRHDPVSIGLVGVIPILLMVLMRYLFPGPETFARIAVPLMGVFPFMALFMVASVAFLRERTAATLERLMTLPVARGDVVAGYAVAFSALAVFQCALTTTFGFVVLGADSDSSPLVIALVALATAMAGAGLGLLSSTIARTEFQAVLWMALLVLPQVMLCGLLVARDDMAPVLQLISAFAPLSYAYDLLDRLADGGPLSAARAVVDVTAILAGAVLPLVAATFTLRRTSG